MLEITFLALCTLALNLREIFICIRIYIEREYMHVYMCARACVCESKYENIWGEIRRNKKTETNSRVCRLPT